MPHKIYLGWDDIVAQSFVVAHDIASSNRNSKRIHIIALARGGWIPARLIGGMLESEHEVTYDSVNAKSYDGMNQGNLLIDDFEIPDSDLTLIIDDLVDTGQTMAEALKIAKTKSDGKICSCVLIHKSNSKVIPDYAAEIQDGGAWVVFPFEVEDDLDESE